MKKYILTNQRKNEYFQENEKKSIEITREMVLFDDPNEIIERKSKTEGKWLQIEDKTRIRNTRKMTLFDDESTKMIIIFIYEGYGVKNRAWILSKSRWYWFFFTNEEKIFLKNDSNAQVEWDLL